MSGSRDPNKKMLTFWASQEEKDLLTQAFETAGFDTLADYLRWIAKAQPKPGQLPEVTQKDGPAKKRAKK